MSDTLPARVTAGDSWEFDLIGPRADYPPPDWELVLSLRLAGGGAITQKIATDTTAAWRFSFAASETAAITPGEYVSAVRAVNASTGQSLTIETGRLIVAPDPMAETADTRSHAERVLAAIEATLEGRASRDADSYSIEGRSITRMPIADLMRWRAHYQAEVAAARRGGAMRQRRIGFC